MNPNVCKLKENNETHLDNPVSTPWAPATVLVVKVLSALTDLLIFSTEN